MTCSPILGPLAWASGSQRAATKQRFTYSWILRLVNRVSTAVTSGVIGYITCNHVATVGPANCQLQVNPERIPGNLNQCQPARADAPGNTCLNMMGSVVESPPLVMYTAALPLLNTVD